MNVDDFFNKMVELFPTIKYKIKLHTIEFGERLDTTVVEDIIMPEVLDLLNKETDQEKIRRVFDYFEDVSINSDEYLNNVFSITALEILGNEKETLDKAKKYMGPVTTTLQREADIALGRDV